MPRNCKKRLVSAKIIIILIIIIIIIIITIITIITMIIIITVIIIKCYQNRSHYRGRRLFHCFRFYINCIDNNALH